MKEKIEMVNQLALQEFESERAHHQKLVKEHARLQQRLENLQGELQVCSGRIESCENDQQGADMKRKMIKVRIFFLCCFYDGNGQIDVCSAFHAVGHKF